MSKSKNGYSVQFEFKDLSFFEEEELFNAIVSTMGDKYKGNYRVVITDPIGGKHLLTDKVSVKPDGEICDNCFQINCAMCSKYINEVKDESSAE